MCTHEKYVHNHYTSNRKLIMMHESDRIDNGG